MKGLGKLKNLRLLQIFGRHDEYLRDNEMFDQYNFPNSLRFLKWKFYLGRSLPQTFQAYNLVGLELPRSRITKLWESGEREVLMKLRFLDLRISKLRTLDLGMTPNLERLDLEGCHDLTEIHAPTECLKRLLYLNLVGCSKLNSLSFIQQLESFELLPLPKLRVSVESLENFPRYASYNLPKLSFKCLYGEEQENSQKSVSLHLHPGTILESVSGNFFGLQHLRHLRFHGCIPKVPNDLDQLKCLEKLTLWSTRIKCLPNSICMLKHLTSLKLIDCQHLEELPSDLGQLVLLEKLVLLLTNIKSLPDSICMMKNLKSLKLIYCLCLEELPRDLGRLECLQKLILTPCKSLKHIPNSICNMKRLKVLDISFTGIRHLPPNISSLEGLRIVGSMEVLQSCDSATEIQTSKGETFCYIQALDNTEVETILENHFTQNFCNRWRWSVVVLAVGLLVRQVIQARVSKKKAKL